MTEKREPIFFLSCEQRQEPSLGVTRNLLSLLRVLRWRSPWPPSRGGRPPARPAPPAPPGPAPRPAAPAAAPGPGRSLEWKQKGKVNIKID